MSLAAIWSGGVAGLVGATKTPVFGLFVGCFNTFGLTKERPCFFFFDFFGLLKQTDANLRFGLEDQMSILLWSHQEMKDSLMPFKDRHAL